MVGAGRWVQLRSVESLSVSARLLVVRRVVREVLQW